MKIQQIMLSLKNSLLIWMKEGKLGWFLLITFIMFFDTAQNIFGLAEQTMQSEHIKKFIDYSTIVRTLIPNRNVRASIIILIILIWIGIIYFRCCSTKLTINPKNTFYIIGHSTLGKTQFRLDEEAAKTTELVIEELDLFEEMKNIDGEYRRLNHIIGKQDIFIDKYKTKISNDNKYGYMGISHTPLVLRAGYRIGDETKIFLFHKDRDEDYYEKLSNNEKYPPIYVEKKHLTDNDRELIVAISTTFPIQDKQLECFQAKDKCILKFKVDEMGYDVIKSENQVADYVDTILTEIRGIVRHKGITKIHMCIASSIAFTFALGQRISNHYDPEIIIYHFDTNNPRKYPWGISLFKEYDNCVIIN